MKLPLCVSVSVAAGVLALASLGSAANPEVGAAILKQFGESQLRNVVLIVSMADDDEPEVWKVYARDPYRPGELVCSVANKEVGRWQMSPQSAGRLLKRVPPQTIDF